MNQLRLPSRISKTLFVVCLLSLSGVSQSVQPFKVIWKKDMSRGPLEFSQIEINEKGEGRFQQKKREQEMIETQFIISPKSVNDLMTLFGQADFFNPSKEFSSSRKVADTGNKTIRLERGISNREVTFNFSEDRIMWQIIDYFENLSNQELAYFELEVALKYDKLSIPKRLEDLQTNIKAKRIIAPERFSLLLDKIYSDPSVMNLGRVQAHQLITLITKKK
jgi:hypothetical protein